MCPMWLAGPGLTEIFSLWLQQLQIEKDFLSVCFNLTMFKRKMSHQTYLCLYFYFLTFEKADCTIFTRLVGRSVGVTINFPFPNDSSFSFSGLLLLRGPNILLHQIFSSFSFSSFFVFSAKRYLPSPLFIPSTKKFLSPINVYGSEHQSEICTVHLV